MCEIERNLSRFSEILFGTLKNTADNILQKRAPIKKRYVQENQALLLNSKINK